MSMVDLAEPRTYRDFGPSNRFVAFRVAVETSDLYVKAHSFLDSETERLIRVARSLVEDAIARRPEFLKSLGPLDDDPGDAPIAARMVSAGRKAGTGPMAAVAGAVAEFVGLRLLELSPEVIVENGGDIFLRIDHPIVMGIFAGESPFSNRIGLKVYPSVLPVGVCTSSATVGPSYSAGRADAATIISRDTILADAVATALGNRVTAPRDLKTAVEWALTVPGVDGALAIIGDKIAAMGDVELVTL
ncbi:MAG: UPF0280 family protein [Desulfomonile sp.]|nr:UPF0280 family protein [Desulfomonile sp.]